MKKIFLDTETTGLSANQGHRIIEIACLPDDGTKPFHVYLNPERTIDASAQKVHGITLEQLKNKPKFKEIASEFLSFIEDAELIIHNATFDLNFLNSELNQAHLPIITPETNKITDTQLLSKKLRPKKKHSLAEHLQKIKLNKLSKIL